MYSSYISSDGYTFNSKSDLAEYEMDRADCDWGPGPNPANYGGTRESESSRDIYERDTSEDSSKQYRTSPEDPKYYHGDREEFDIIHETEKAYLLSNGIAKFWCPKALIIDVIRIRNSIAGRIWKGLNRDIIF